MPPKFKVGDLVKCYRKGSEACSPFDFCGQVISVNDTGDGVEYSVENAPALSCGLPVLIWEGEMELL